MKSLVEWKDGNVWRQVHVVVSYSHKGNCWFKHAGAVYVLADMKEGTKIIMKSGDKWVHAGRVARGCIFLGEGQSYSETCAKNADADFADGKWKKPVFT
jgi:hypothetical protein